jgi:hypothetical protein
MAGSDNCELNFIPASFIEFALTSKVCLSLMTTKLKAVSISAKPASSVIVSVP